jgi:hypothetical protein
MQLYFGEFLEAMESNLPTPEKSTEDKPKPDEPEPEPENTGK